MTENSEITEATPTKCVRDALGRCSRWCTHPNARPGFRFMRDYGKSSERADVTEPEHVGTLRIGGKIAVDHGYQFDVNNIVMLQNVSDHASDEQTVELHVVLTRPIPKEK